VKKVLCEVPDISRESATSPKNSKLYSSSGPDFALKNMAPFYDVISQCLPYLVYYIDHPKVSDSLDPLSGFLYLGQRKITCMAMCNNLSVGKIFIILPCNI